MRPPNRILLIGPDDDRMAMLRFTLRLWFYVWSETTQRGALMLISKAYWDAIVLVNPRPSYRPLEAKIRPLLKGRERSLLVLLDGPYVPELDAEFVLWCPSTRRLLDRLRVITQKKRGPAPGSDIAQLSGKRLRAYWVARRSRAA